MATSSAFPDFAEFLAQVASITADLLGAYRVDLRSIDVLPRSEQYVAGSAYIQSGHMEVGHDVPRFIEGLLTSRDRPLTAAELEVLRDALGTFLHKSIHLALPNDYDPGLALHSLEVPAEVFLEEGVTEAATHALPPQLLAPRGGGAREDGAAGRLARHARRAGAQDGGPVAWAKWVRWSRCPPSARRLDQDGAIGRAQIGVARVLAASGLAASSERAPAANTMGPPYKHAARGITR